MPSSEHEALCLLTTARVGLQKLLKELLKNKPNLLF